MDQTKALLKNSIKSHLTRQEDKLKCLTNLKKWMKILRLNYSFKDWEAVTKDDVKEMATNINLEIIYLLSGKEVAADE